MIIRQKFYQWKLMEIISETCAKGMWKLLESILWIFFLSCEKSHIHRLSNVFYFHWIRWTSVRRKTLPIFYLSGCRFFIFFHTTLAVSGTPSFGATSATFRVPNIRGSSEYLTMKKRGYKSRERKRATRDTRWNRDAALFARSDGLSEISTVKVRGHWLRRCNFCRMRWNAQPSSTMKRGRWFGKL